MGQTGGNEAHLPRLELDQLLDELHGRLDVARGTQGRTHDLLEAVLSIGRELDLTQVLRRIVGSAVALVDAEYGALGVVEGGRMAEFLTVGVGADEARAIGSPPSGHGILGELNRHPAPLRLTEIGDHPSSCGFPPHQPPMHSFLGIPIRVRDEVFGNLYLTQKRGGGQFDDEDETVLGTFAVAAGVAVENARLYESARARQRWIEANADIVAGLLSGVGEVGEEEVLERIVRHARDIATADLGVLALPADGGALKVVIAVGTCADDHRGLVLPREGSFLGTAMAAEAPITTEDICKDPRAGAGPPRFGGLGPAVAVPMITDEGVRGAVLLAREQGAAPFTEIEAEPLLAFTGQAALALRLAERRRAAEQLTVLEDRDRIARDLHDLAVQRLFATGMTLQSVQRFVDHPQAAERLQRAVDDLDETIRIIRATIFGLRADEAAGRPPGLRARAAAEVEQAAGPLGFTPALRMEGLLDTDVPPPIADEAVAVVTEALSNTARHARAGAVEVALAVTAGRLTVTVTDDGKGVPAGTPRRGLANLARRAEHLGGGFGITPGPRGGTRLTWCVPLGGTGG
ncbi:GAF domain-containing sensor histidine kinase [Streptomyces sp. NPDC021224]|uniref:sensor histidine kinase n=1 Tax=unclassified Streptomyces TaxID=2593676 RepID=UPI0037B9E356